VCEAPSLKKQIADDIMAVSEKAHQPPVTLVQGVATALTSALAGKRVATLSNEKLGIGGNKFKATLAGKHLASQKLVGQLAADIQKTLQSAGTATVGFHETVGAAQEALIGLGVSTAEAQNLADLLRNIGEKVRGPEDMPLQDLPPRVR
jgi:hypothetical protein